MMDTNTKQKIIETEETYINKFRQTLEEELRESNMEDESSVKMVNMIRMIASSKINTVKKRLEEDAPPYPKDHLQDLDTFLMGCRFGHDKTLKVLAEWKDKRARIECEMAGEKEHRPLYPGFFMIVSRNSDNEVKTKATYNFVSAAAEQTAMLTGVDAEIAKAVLDPETLDKIAQNLSRYGRDRLANDEEEVYIFHIPGRDSFR